MIKLRTLLLLFPFVALIGCSDDEESEIPVSTTPIAAECHLSSKTTTQNYTVENSPEALQEVSKESYAYTDELMDSYTYSFTDVYTDSTGADTVLMDNSYQFDFSYDGSNLLAGVSSGDEEIVSVQSVDNKVHTMTVYFTNDTEVVYEFTYDGSGNVASIQTDDFELDSALSLTFTYQDSDLTRMDLYFGSSNELYHEYTYFDNVKNPYYGLNFYAIALIEANGTFYNLDYSYFSPSLLQDVVLGQRTTDGFWDKGFVYQDAYTYTTNSKGYPISASMPDISSEGVTLSTNIQFGYTNCD